MSVEALLAAARAKGVMIATAESCTGGLIAGALTDPPGASDVLDRGFVTYSNAAKERDLGLPRALLERHGAVSEAVAGAMASAACRLSGADLGLAITGIAGPDGGTPHKPVGLVWFGIALARGSGEEVWTESRSFPPKDRNWIRSLAARYALFLALQRVRAQDAPA